METIFGRNKGVSFVLALALMLSFGLAKNVVLAEDAGDIQNSITSIQKKLDKEQAAKAALEAELSKIQGSVNSTQKEILKVQASIKETQATIARKESEIDALEKKNSFQKAVLTDVMREMYYAKKTSVVDVMLDGRDFSAILGNVDNAISLEQKVFEIIDEIRGTQEQVSEDKEELAKIKEAHEKTLAVKEDIKQDLVEDKIETQEDIADKEAVIKRLNKELSELQGDLSKILGKSYNAKDIKEAVEFASGKTGVPKGFLFGMLKMESNLGANVGGCTYGEVEKGAEASYKAKKLGKTAWATFQRRRDIFKTICNELDIDYKKQKVSCNPRGYTGTGGAMGVAQFMPDTWMGYKSQVTSKTGHNPPSPWNLTDGVTAMALKLARVPGVTAGKESAYKTAACAYLGTCYKPYIDGILYWAKNYKQLL